MQMGALASVVSALLAASAVVAQDATTEPVPSFDEVVQTHAKIVDATVTGRIDYVVYRKLGPRALPQPTDLSEIQREQAAKAFDDYMKSEAFRQLSEKGKERVRKQIRQHLAPENAQKDGALEYLRGTGVYFVQFVFDRPQASYKAIALDLRDIPRLLAEHGLGPEEQANLPSHRANVRIGARTLEYNPQANLAVLSVPTRARVRAEEVLQFGLITAEYAEADGKWDLSRDASSGGLIKMTRKTGPVERTFYLDSQLSYRLVRALSHQDGKLVAEVTTSFRRWGDLVFPDRHHHVRWQMDGALSADDKYCFTSVSLGTPIGREEFGVDVTEATRVQVLPSTDAAGGGPRQPASANDIIRGGRILLDQLSEERIRGLE